MIQHQGRQPAILLLAFMDVAMSAVSLYLAYLVRREVLPRWFEVWQGSVALHPAYSILLIGSLPILLGALYMSGGYNLARLQRPVQIFLGVFKAFLMSTVGVLALAYALRDQTFSRAIVATYLVLASTAFFLLRLTTRELLAYLKSQGIGLSDAIIVGTGPAARAIAEAIGRRPYLGYRVAGFVAVPGEKDAEPGIPTLGSVEELPAIVDRSVVDAVIFGTSLDEAARYEKIIWKLEEVGTTVHLRGDAVGVLLSRTFVGEFEGMPILTLRSTPADWLALVIKRTTDVIGSLVALIGLTPVFAVVAGAVKLTDRGPVFYGQERVGLNGRRFRMWKFRSMFVDAEAKQKELLLQNEMSGPVFKMKHDPRITPVGKWIRRFSIDELPQLWNVLLGDMSLVGPRPPIPKEVQQYERWQRRRLSMKPGITCLWQVGGRNEVDFDTWMKLDMEYIDNWSLGLDMKILLKTIPVVLLARGAR
ncbi:MAG: sugar transferase [Steroidobacteraceae bacterium]|nr:sugar transferase [Steroidobacteraceae bacterium]